jgi:chromosome partitioning protein
MPQKKVFAIANQKGGVGKTTTSINLGAFLASLGRKTLIIDLDPQSNTTTGLGIDAHRIEKSIYELLVHEGVSVQQVLKPLDNQPNLFLLPATVNLYGAEIDLVYIDNGREVRLKRIIDGVRNDYDFILIDCPPSLGLLTLNALTAADGVILPLQCEYFALEGMAQLLHTIQRVRKQLNPSLDLFGVVLTMFDPRTKLAGEVVEEISQHFAKERFQQIIPRNVRLAEAPSHGVSILQHDPRSPGALAYKALAEEVIARAAVTEAVHV